MTTPDYPHEDEPREGDSAEVTAEVEPQAKFRMVADEDHGSSSDSHG